MDESDVASRIQIAQQYLQFGNTDVAEQILRPLLEEEPVALPVLKTFATVLARSGRLAQAIEIAEKAVLLDPDDAALAARLVNFLRDRGAQLAQVGDLNEARHYFSRALALDPRRTDILYMRTLISNGEFPGDEVSAMEGFFREPGLCEEDRRRLAFSLGKVFDELGAYSKAFDYIAEGNRIAREAVQYSTQAQRRKFASLRRLFDREYFRRCRDVGIDDGRPIIVTGMARSGTTLVEQILASHPLVYGGGELRAIGEIASGASHRPGVDAEGSGDFSDPELLRKMGSDYCAALRAEANGEPFVTDKNLASVNYIGLIAMMLPNAKIVHCLRDPRDQGLSAFMSDFGNEQPYTMDLKELGEYSVMHGEQMQYWKDALPERIYTVHYERLVSNPENQIRALLASCNLGFSSDCLRFHENRREISTLSLSQLRKPIHGKSIGRWKNYERQMQPLIHALRNVPV